MNRRNFLGTAIAGLLAAFLPAKVFDFGKPKKKFGGIEHLDQLPDPAFRFKPDLNGWVSYKFKYTVTMRPDSQHRIRLMNV